MTVKLLRLNERYRDLTPGQAYVVIGIEGGEFRILNDAARPYLYSPRLFKVLDARQPHDWVAEIGDHGERYAYPPPLYSPGFFEDFLDDEPKAVRTFWRILNQRPATIGKVA